MNKISARTGRVRALLLLATCAFPPTAYSQQFDATRGIPLRIQTHIGETGDVDFREYEPCGKIGTGKYLQAVFIQAADLPDLKIRMRGHIANTGDLPFVNFFGEGATYFGTKGQSLSIEGISLELVGDSSQKFDIFYRTYVQGIGWLPTVSNGLFSGTRGQHRSVEAIQVVVKPKG